MKMTIVFSELNSGTFFLVWLALFWFLGQFQNTNKGKWLTTRGATYQSTQHEIDQRNWPLRHTIKLVNLPFSNIDVPGIEVNTN